MTNASVVKAPVCGMDVEKANAAGRTVYTGQTYFFSAVLAAKRSSTAMLNNI